MLTLVSVLTAMSEVQQVSETTTTESSVSNDESTVVLLNFLREHYDNRIAVEGAEQNKIQTPYVVAYHHFALFHTQLKKWTDLLFTVAKKYPNVKFAIGELSAFKSSTKYSPTEYDASRSPLLYTVNHHRNKAKLQRSYDFKGLCECCDELLDDDELESEPLPLPNNSYVKTAVALNFTTVVETNPKDVFILFYRPSCYACKPLLPQLERLAGVLHGNGDSKHIDVVRMNISYNCIPDSRFSRSLTPQFYFKRSGENHYFEFSLNTERTVENMLKFIAKHATKELRRYNRNGEEWNRKDRRKCRDK